MSDRRQETSAAAMVSESLNCPRAGGLLAAGPGTGTAGTVVAGVVGVGTIGGSGG